MSRRRQAFFLLDLISCSPKDAVLTCEDARLAAISSIETHLAALRTKHYFVVYLTLGQGDWRTVRRR
jgi:hypothetical protein